jgi:hypothetical protein
MESLHGKRIQTMENRYDNLTWAEGDTWYGWVYSPEKKRYYFDDIGSKSLIELWESHWAWEEAEAK